AMARAEQYVGTRSGGMDQAICAAARRGYAAKIDFEPLRVEHVAVPSGWRFVVAHSLVLADKSGSARAAYNARRAECERALALVCTSIGSESDYRSLLERHGAAELVRIGARALDGTLRRRFRHAVSEAERVDAARRALLARDADRFGRLMDES